ncbi:guanylate kinase [bacterium]|nr:guanylate kinase [bacterium]
MSPEGLIVAIAAPSGAGKTSVCRGLLNVGENFVFSVSFTTRTKRTTEINGDAYFFISKEEFEKKRAENLFIEDEFVHGNWYGTEKAQIDKALRKNKIILLDIDVKGALAVKKIYGDSAFLVYIDVPSSAILRERLKTRGTESEEEIQKRMTRVPEETEAKKHFDMVIVNNSLEETIQMVFKQIKEERNIYV